MLLLLLLYTRRLYIVFAVGLWRNITSYLKASFERSRFLTNLPRSPLLTQTVCFSGRLGNIMFWYGFKARIRGHKFIMEESSCAYTNSGYTKNPGSGQPGYMWSNIRNVLDEEDGFCGIYEFQVRGTLLGQLQSGVVYVVSMHLSAWRRWRSMPQI